MENMIITQEDIDVALARAERAEKRFDRDWKHKKGISLYAQDYGHRLSRATHFRKLYRELKQQFLNQ